MSECKQAQSHEQQIAELKDSRLPKTEREHAAVREIERLEQRLAAAESELNRLRRAMNDEKVASGVLSAFWRRVYGGNNVRRGAVMQVTFHPMVEVYTQGILLGKLEPLYDEAGGWTFKPEPEADEFTQDELFAIAEKLRELNGEPDND